jgi:transketolase
MLPVAIDAADALRGEISCRVVSMHTVKPLDAASLLECCNETAALFTVEEHSRIGGLGSAVGEWLVENDLKVPLHVFAAKDCFMHRSGNQAYLRESNGLTVAQVAKGVAERMKLLSTASAKRYYAR